ncbi:conjugative transfer signal peptidase TraF [Nitrobacter winogradskyi]|uniref:Conjugative transfer signal peptidase TraF n=1 Tax=Nitrobacter winogradskyi TaxID=913 RepID=A0ACC6APN0_NITWI|nr:conjugative transfer signal peptidase TraF [Nitrobacter winogradskyi]MCP2001117.1 conjugative transfer signal peptidase TraF [Nitrobacter winogradskyi]
MHIGLFGSLTCLGLFGPGWWGGFRLNATPSYPLGLWRIATLDRAVTVGDRVFICLPPGPALSLGLTRGYIRCGLCAEGASPLIKTVAALPGQTVAIAGTVTIDGHPLRHSHIHPVDAEGRQLTAYSGGKVPPGHLFLHSGFSGSYDSRYFGPVLDTGVLGLAEPVITFTP